MTEADLAKTLLPCPFCGCQTPVLRHGPSLYVRCPACYTEGPWNDDSEDRAITAWNTRTGQLIVAQAGDVVASIRAQPYPECDDYIEVRRDERERIISAMPSISAKDAEIARLLEALHDTIRSPKGVVPVSAEPFYEPSRCAP